ncbi:energy-coupling factor ABC transporter ATP-binding protein [Sulfurimonas sp. SWIR-19]|uniref:energy-coupling factor ABC transporter ATP-binding protein n=1 Tax=Sulfurimonas sp. SWIR-19 TaxID=2878390 RepID=UPI001CF13677|nr:ABC transporter ATP-binding protein [Sulfurimonas sp. SWIR-19]UCN01294.1 energy-coupling factor ABC transporter ATP-binding protein [Sulfurimonas sp. SWIR-19]
MITLHNIEFYYEEKKVLHDISLTINKGEKVVLLGSNGSGKSTLLRILAALYFPKKGEYLFHTKKISKKNIDKNFRKKVGILFQNPESMIFNPTVKDEIAFSLREFDEENIDKKVLAISEKFGITHLLDKNPLELSGGEKQKVVLASILVYEPEILLLDEPTAAMDPRTTGWFVDLMLEIETTVIVATHDLSIAYEVSNRAIVLDEKHTMVYDGDIEKLFRDLQTLQKANLIHKHKHRHKKDFTHSHYHLHF